MGVRNGFRRFEKQTVLLHTKDGQSFRGVLTQYGDCAVLSHNVATWNGEQEVTLGGEVVVACENISFFQTIPPKV